jgi:DivIVA domain-containing protein
MPLTPADVHNVAFSKPPIGKRGYNEDEVDAFLDLVENELTRLIEENSDLRQRVNELDQELAAARGGEGAQAKEAIPQYPPEPESEAAKMEAEPAADVSNKERAVKAAKVLTLAQETADRLTGTAKAESEKMIADARARADQILSEAQREAETTVAEARERADALQADAERKQSEVMGPINQQRTVLEGRLEQLRTFEREYRTRLKTYLESQLEELGQRGSAAPVDSSATNEAGGVQPVQSG